MRLAVSTACYLTICRVSALNGYAMRSLRIKLFLLSLLLSAASHAESIRILVQNSPLAGSQYYAVTEIGHDIQLDDRLTLSREPDNRHDRYAVRVDWKGHKLGYIPRTENRAIARALDAGEQLEARVSKLRADANPWRRVEFEVYLIL